MSQLIGEVGSVEVNGWPVHYEKFGTGPEIILMIPGAIGTPRTDFMAQLEGEHALDQDKFTLVCIELPGWGRSRPHARKYNKSVYVQDAVCAEKVMKTLGYKRYSVIGSSDGTKPALILGYRYPEQIKCIVVSGVFLIVNRQTVAPTLATEDTNKWPKQLLDNYLRSYDKQTIQELWSGYVGFCKVFVDSFPNGCWTNNLAHIKCPVLIVHGDRDPLCNIEHALYGEKEIPMCRLHRFPRGAHNVHLTYAADFKRIAEKFIEEADN